MSIRNGFAVVVFCLAGILTGATVSQAASITYTFDTSLLAAVGTYSLDFQLTSNEPPTANHATLIDFEFGGGALISGSSVYPPSGGFAGSVDAPPLVLSVADVFNSFTQDFTPGAFVRFTLDLTNTAPVGGVPDHFSFAILLDGIEIETTDSQGFNRLLRADLSGDANGPLTSQFDVVASVPEPATLLLLGLGCAGIAYQRRRLA